MDDFINQLLKDRGVSDSLDPEVRAQLAADLKQRAVDLINRRIIDAMSDETAAEFTNYVNDNPDDAAGIQRFIEEKVPDREQIAAAALVELRALYLGQGA